MATNQQPLNIRNNNPGNLRFVGQPGAAPGEGGFAKFETPQAGLDAMRAQIELDTQTRGLNLSQFLNKYAPPSENKTTNYIDFVAKKTGLDPNAPVPVSAIPQLQTAMIEMEGGPRSLSYFTQTAAKEPRTTVPVEKRPGVQVAAAFNPTDLPSSYTSALALNYLADTDPEGVTMSRVNEMLTELMEDGGGAAKPAGGKVLQQFAQAKSVDPFQFVLQPEEPKQTQQRVVPKMPKMMADGGLATRAMVANRPKLTRTDQDWLQARQREFDAYNSQADEYQKAVDAYNAKVEAYNAAQGRGVENPGEFTMAAPVLPQTTAEQAEAYQTAAQDRAKRFYMARAAGIENVVNPEKYNLSGMSFSFADGGEVDYNQMAEQMTVGTLPEGQRPAGEVFQNIGRDVVRGAQYLPYDLIGAPVDIATMAMRPFGYNVEKPIGGSEWLIEKSRQAGIAQQPTGSAAETATRIGMGFVNPAAVARQIPRGIAALERGAKTLELPGFAQTAPVGALFPKPRVDTSLLLPKENKPFIGEVERIVADLPGPVTKEQFLGMMRKQGRNYEIGRVEQALESLPEGSKIEPVDLFQRLQATSPSRFTTEIIPPGSKHMYNTMDNPFPSNKPGAVNLLLDLPEDQRAAADLADQAKTLVADLSPYKFLSELADARSSTVLEMAGQENAISSKVDNLAPIIRGIAELTGKNANDYLGPLSDIAQQSDALMEISKARAKLAYPAFTDLWRTYTNVPKSQLPEELRDNYGGLSVNKLLAKISDEGLTDYERAVKNAPPDFRPVEQDQIDNLRQYNRILRESSSAYDTGYKDQANLVEKLISSELGTSFGRLRDLTDRIANRVQKMADEIPTGYYEGTHRAITSKNPISFSRFVEFTPNQADQLGISMPDQDRGAIMFLELQSDRQKALRLSKEVEEAFPNMGKLPQVTQQLMIKNAIYGGIKMNKGLVLFPGSDSAQAQLYEKLGPNLKQAIKDLGPGFKVSEFKFPNEKGDMTTRWGVYIDEDAAKRIMQQGMRFAKGGMVDKPLYDRAA